MEDYVSVDDEEESAINKLLEEPKDLVSKQWKDRDLRKLLQMMTEGDMIYFDGENNPTANIKTLVELAKRKELLVVRDEEGQRRLVKKASITNQIVVLRLAREMVMRRAQTHHRGMSATLQEIKKRCYWQNCALNVAQMIHKFSIWLENYKVDLHDREAFSRAQPRCRRVCTGPDWTVLYIGQR